MHTITNESGKQSVLNPENFASCVNRAMFLIEAYEAQIKSEGYEWNVHTSSCRWAVEQAIINRNGGTMMAAANAFVESIEERVDAFNNI